MEPKTEITLVMEPAEAVAIVNLLGSLPTSQSAYPLWLKLKAQVEAFEAKVAALESK